MCIVSNAVNATSYANSPRSSQVLLSRATELKIPTWDRVGRLKHTKMPSKGHFSGKDYLIADVLAGRILCDTYISSKELLRETTYSLSNLAATQLKENRLDASRSEATN